MNNFKANIQPLNFNFQINLNKNAVTRYKLISKTYQCGTKTGINVVSKLTENVRFVELCL